MTSVHLQWEALITLLFSVLLFEMPSVFSPISHQLKNLNLILIFNSIQWTKMTLWQVGRLINCLFPKMKISFLKSSLLFLRCSMMKAHPPVNYAFHTTRQAEIRSFLLLFF